jgi:hypothetical protein
VNSFYLTKFLIYFKTMIKKIPHDAKYASPNSIHNLSTAQECEIKDTNSNVVITYRESKGSSFDDIVAVATPEGTLIRCSKGQYLDLASGLFAGSFLTLKRDFVYIIGVTLAFLGKLVVQALKGSRRITLVSLDAAYSARPERRPIHVGIYYCSTAGLERANRLAELVRGSMGAIYQGLPVHVEVKHFRDVPGRPLGILRRLGSVHLGLDLDYFTRDPQIYKKISAAVGAALATLNDELS